MAAEIAANAGHLAYFYCYDNAEPDAVCAFQQYASPEAAQAFLQSDAYRAYEREVGPLLSGPPEVTSLVPIWTKHSLSGEGESSTPGEC